MLVEAFLIWFLGTTSVVPFRILNIVIGSSNVVILYLLARKFSLPYPELAGLLIATNPVLIFVDISGMAEPIAFLFIFASLFFYEKRPFVFGVLLALASMCRVEFWAISWGLIACYGIFRKSTTAMMPALLGWLVVMSPYLFHLWVQTGDPLYPLRTNIAADIVGQWFATGSIDMLSLVWRGIFVGILAFSLFGLIYLVWRKPKSYIIYAFILGNLAQHGITFGLSAYSSGFVPLYFIDRLIVLEYIFIGLAGVPFLIKYVPTIFPAMRGVASRRAFGAIVLVGVVLLYSYVGYMSTAIYTDQAQSDIRLFQVGNRIAANYAGGTIISDNVAVTYRLINLGIAPEHILGSTYAPRDNLGQIYNWLVEYNVTIILFSGRVAAVLPALQDGSDHSPFYVLFKDNSTGEVVYRVNSTQLRMLASSG